MQHSLFGGLAACAPTIEEDQSPLQERLIEDAVFTVIDLETTGLNAKKSGITEVVAISYRNGEEVDKYATLVKPSEAIPEEVEMLTGITNDMVRNAPPLIAVLGELTGFLGSQPILVGHNVGFDIGFLREKVTQNGLDAFLDRYDPLKSFCTRLLALKAMPGLPSYEGIMVATAVGYHNPNPHRAEADVRMSAAILFSLLTKIQAENKSIRKVGDLLAWQGPVS
jgi:DNA polymerase III epsilon subunit family exonuclease